MNETENVATTHAVTGTAQHFEGVSGAINVSIVAFSIVFGVLIILTLMIYAMRLFASSDNKGGAKTDVKKNDTKPAASVNAAPAVQATSAAAPAVIAQNSLISGAPQTKIVAAITAAIYAATGGTGKILSIQAQPQINKNGAANFGAGAWRTSGRIALVHNRLTRSWR